MRSKAILTLAITFAITSLARAASPVVDVTISVDRPFAGGGYTIGVGETATLSVFAQLQPTYATTGNGVFGWEVSVLVDDPSVVNLFSGTVDRSGWTNTPSTSSDGTPTAGDLLAIFDTGETDSELGVSSPVRLFSIDFTGGNPGTSLLSVGPSGTTGVDFVTWMTDTGGVYSSASALISVVPEPASAVLLGFGAIGLFLRRKMT